MRRLLQFALVLVTGTAHCSDPLQALGLQPTMGAAAGYLDDRACAQCHRQLFDSYQAVGMSQSLRKPGNARPMEDFGKPFFHAASQRYFAIRKDDDGLTFERYQLDAQGSRINQFEVPIAWVLGSGNRARSYLYQTDWGELYQLPLGWYSEDGKWEMSPGFEFSDHPGIHRRVQRECMFCHNAFPEVVSDSDDFLRPDQFPSHLPEGTGCQRCHGPGAEHVRAVLRGESIEDIHSNITNPAKLQPEERDSVCFQCHMLPSVAVAGARRFDRDLYSFRPGERISEYLVHVNVVEQGVEDIDRFEINHHGYRLWSSACYQKSDGRLGCISCHDPHRKPDSKAFRRDVATVCAECHETPEHAVENNGGRTCADCHMPTRRTRDVVHVTMTDHRIARGPFDFDALVAPMRKTPPVISGIDILNDTLSLEPGERIAYRTVPALRAGVSIDTAAQALDTVMEQSLLPVPGYERINAALTQRDFQRAATLSGDLLVEHEDEPLLWTALGVAQLGLGMVKQAEISLSRSSELLSTPESEYNLGLSLHAQGKSAKALEAFMRAIEMRPVMTNAWKYRALAEEALGNLEAARNSWQRALELSPSRVDLYRGMVMALKALAEDAEANRYLEHARKILDDPESLVDIHPLAVSDGQE